MMNQESDTTWHSALHAAHCKNCRAAFFVPANAGAPLCPNCLAARLEPVPALAHAAPPELILPFTVPDETLAANLERWLREIPLRAPTLNAQDLSTRLTRVFIPMYLADASVWGAWQMQVGFDYLVASSEERYNGGTWQTQRVNETRVRWEPRAGDITRKYENIIAPALEQHPKIMRRLGGQNSSDPPFDPTRAKNFSADALGSAFVRAPDIEPNAAWEFARQAMERRAAQDCRTASGAQHSEQFQLRAAYGEPHWTLMLLPVYVTSYADDEGKWCAIHVNGQSGFVSGTKRASMKQAGRWAIGLAAFALLAFMFTVMLAASALIVPPFAAIAIVLLIVTLALCLAAPLPLIRVWQFNRQTTDNA